MVLNNTNGNSHLHTLLTMGLGFHVLCKVSCVSGETDRFNKGGMLHGQRSGLHKSDMSLSLHVLVEQLLMKFLKECRLF